jgi:hypothetical protein
MLTLAEHSQALKAGDFSAQLAGSSLLVPKRLLDLLRTMNIDTAEKLLLLASDFKEVLAAQLGWEEPQLTRARDQLLELIKGALSKDVRNAIDKPPTQYAMGARLK